MLISSTATSCAGSRRSSVMGRPVSEFRLPSLRRTLRVRARTSATISLAIVLPVEPVIPTTRTAERPRHQAASSCSATSVSGTCTSAMIRSRGKRDRPLDQGDGGTVGGGLADEARGRRPAHPAAPRTGCPAMTCRESTAAVVKWVTVVGPRRRPPVAATRSSRRIDGGTRLPATGLAESSSVIGWPPVGRAGPAGWPGSSRMSGARSRNRSSGRCAIWYRPQVAGRWISSRVTICGSEAGSSEMKLESIQPSM